MATILVVQETKEARPLVDRLSSAGHTVELLPDGRTAQERLLKPGVDAIILDGAALPLGEEHPEQFASPVTARRARNGEYPTAPIVLMYSVWSDDLPNLAKQWDVELISKGDTHEARVEQYLRERLL